MKFNTTSSSLFNNNNKETIPDWMKDINTDIKEVEHIDLEIEAQPAFKEKQTVSRKEGNAEIREVTASFNETKVKLDSKIELSKFLSGKFFKCEQKILGNMVVISTKLQGVPADFNFIYNIEKGKISQAKTFNVDFDNNNYEYPFSKAAFEECLMDIKSNKPKMSKIAENFGQYSIINREEIIRRYNGKLREATDKINDLISEGLIVGVGSNSYGSFYDLDQLIPQEEKEKGMEKQSEFEFVNNSEHVATNQHKIASVLAIESSKFLSEIFNDYRILKSGRDKNELLVSANVLTKNGTTLLAHFSFDIENEKVASLKVVEYDNDRLSLEQFLEKVKSNVVLNEYKNNNKIASRIYKGVVLTEKNIKHILSSCVSHENINKVINNWVTTGAIKPINSTTFITENNFENLLNNINVVLLTDEEKEQMLALANKSLMLKTERQNVKDTGVRDTENVEKTLKEVETKLKMALSKKLVNYKIANLSKIQSTQAIFDECGDTKEILPRYSFDLEFINPKNGTSHSNKFLCHPYDSTMYIFTFNDDNYEVNLDEYLNNMKSNPLLAAYLNTNSTNNGFIIKLSKNQLYNKLSDICSMDDIDKAFDKWVTSGLATLIADNTIVSKCSIEQLLNSSDIGLLSKEDMEDIQLAKQHFGSQLTAIETVDTGVREMSPFVDNDSQLRACNEFLAKTFGSFKVTSYCVNEDTVSCIVKLFDDESGLNIDCSIIFNMDGNDVNSAYASINDKKVSLTNIKMAFAKNETLKKYLVKNNGKKFNVPMIITVEKLKEKMKHICSVQEIEAVVNGWCKIGKVEKIGENVLASKYTLEQLINDSNIKPLTDEEIKNRLQKCMKNKELILTSAYINDSDTRQLMETWSPERILLESKKIISKTFNHFEVLDANLSDTKYELKIRALNPKTGVKQVMNCNFKIMDSKLASLESITSNDHTSTELNVLLESYKPSDSNTLGYTSKSALKNVFSKVMDVNSFDNAIELLASKNMINKVGNDAFTLNYSMAELVQYLADQKLTNIEAAKDQIEQAQRNDKICINDKRVLDSGSRELEAKEKELSPQMIALRNKLNNMITSAYNGKLLTANKFNDLSSKLSNAKEEKDLETVSKELRRYLM